MEGKRLQKFEKLALEVLSELFQKELLDVRGKAFITFTKVNVTPDLGLCKVYISVMLETPQVTADRLNDNVSHIRNHFGKKIRNQVRKIPELRFYIDDTAEEASKMDQLFSDLDIPEE